MHSCHSTPRCWTGPELSKQKPTRNKESTEHSAYASFFPPFASRVADSEILIANSRRTIEAPGWGRAPVLNQGYPHSENEERANITLGQMRLSKALSFSASFSIFSSHALTYSVHFLAPVYLAAIRRSNRYACCAAQWQSGGSCKTRVRRYPKAQAAATNRSSRVCNRGARITLPGHSHGILPTVAVL